MGGITVLKSIVATICKGNDENLIAYFKITISNLNSLKTIFRKTLCT